MRKAEANGLDLCGKEQQKGMIRKYRNNFRMRYNGGPSARVTLLRRHVKVVPHSVRSRLLGCLSEMHLFLRTYMSKRKNCHSSDL